jgi:hypothetical protein
MAETKAAYVPLRGTFPLKKNCLKCNTLYYGSSETGKLGNWETGKLGNFPVVTEWYFAQYWERGGSCSFPFSIEAPAPNENPDDAMEREPKKVSTATEKGALWHSTTFLFTNLSLTSAMFTPPTRL